MGLASQFRETWDRMTGKSPEQPPAQSKPPEPQQSQKPLPTHEDLRRARGNEPRPAERFSPANAEKMREAAKHKPPPAPKPVEREATKMEYTRTAQPAPTPGGMGSTFRNPTSTFKPEQAKPAPDKAPDAPVRRTLADFQKRDDQAAEKQKAADRAASQPGDRKVDRFRRPGEAPRDQSFSQAAERVSKERQMVNQFSRQFDPTQGRER